MMKPSLLLISGWAFPASAWEPIVHPLEATWQVRVLGADTVLAGWTPGQDPDVVAGRIRSHLPSSSPCVLGGWSLGGMLALEAAPRLTRELAGVLLISTTPRFCRDETQDWGVPEAAVRAMTAGLRNAPGETLQQFYASSAAPAEPDPLQTARWEQECLRNLEGLRTGLQYLRSTDLRQQVSCGGLPSVLIHGRSDAIIPDQASRTLGAHLRPSRLELTAHAGHDLPLRRPDVVHRGLHSLAGMCE